MHKLFVVVVTVCCSGCIGASSAFIAEMAEPMVGPRTLIAAVTAAISAAGILGGFLMRIERRMGRLERAIEDLPCVGRERTCKNETS
jgi:hypothetical protein